jgi:hypothetical protein
MDDLGIPPFMEASKYIHTLNSCFFLQGIWSWQCFLSIDLGFLFKKMAIMTYIWLQINHTILTLLLAALPCYSLGTPSSD